MTRRKFLTASGVAGAGALAAGATGLGLTRLFSTAHPRHTVTSKLVIVTLYGGNDGLNTVVPYADSAYHDARPGLAYRPERVLHLDGALGLNPGLAGLRRVWQDKRLAIVLGVGYAKPDRSHFRSMDIWQTASPGAPVGTGWIGRWLDGTDAPPEAAVSFEPVLPPLLAGATRAGACVSPDGMHLPRGVTTGAVNTLGRRSRGEPALQGRAATAFRDLLRVDGIIRPEASPTARPSPPAFSYLPATTTGGALSLADQLGLVARCVERGVPTRVYSVSLGGFDTHADEINAQERLLGQLDSALTAFADRMAATDAGRRVTTVVYSEFGRRVHANASGGTDHGTAGPLFLIGSPVAGGWYGEQPNLRDLDDGDLKATTDFRDVFGTLLGSVLQVDPVRYLEGYRPRTLPFLRAGG
jgi:uncharacterized protein (DUF1501 family)